MSALALAEWPALHGKWRRFDQGCRGVQPTADLDEGRRCVLAVSVGS